MAMDIEQRGAISKGRAKKNPMLKAARDRGVPTLRVLSEKLIARGYQAKPSFLSRVASGDKPMPPKLAALLSELIGWPS